MAGTNFTSSISGEPVFEYKQQPWGDLIYGTKDQLQAIGIAQGMAFPGEPGANKRRMNVIDPRGFHTTVRNNPWSDEGLYSAHIHFPGREREEEPLTSFATGVQKREAVWYDEYIGTAEALAAAGLVRQDQLPGQPGMRKVTVRILPDGTLPKGAPTANCYEAKNPGAKTIQRASKNTYEVLVVIPHEEYDRRLDKYRIAGLEWEARMLALPRPAPLVDLPGLIGRPAKVKASPSYSVDGNVIYLVPRKEVEAAK